MREIEIYITSARLSERDAAERGIEELKKCGFNVETKFTPHYEKYYVVSWGEEK